MVDVRRLEQELDEDQSKAALHVDGPMLILAGAGSGKTRAITYKIAHLISFHQVDPRRILAVTFTNKAAREMKERIGKLLEGQAALDWTGTFHSMCMRILRLCLQQPLVSQKLGWSYSRNFAIYDDDDQKRTLKEVALPHLGEVDAQELRRLAGKISRCKNQLSLQMPDGQTPTVTLQTPEVVRENARFGEEERFAAIYEGYQQKLMAADAMDFDDLMFRVVQMFGKLPNLAAQFAKRFQYVFVDEYQDTNDVQYALLRFLVNEQRNITVVGDDDQSIYGWRGANIAIIRSFHEDFAPVTVVKLERNYRSTGLIVRGAGSVIENNERPESMRKNVYSQLEDGEPIRVNKVLDDRSEAQKIASVIGRLGMNAYGQTAVFYRTNAMSRGLEKALSDLRIPCRIYGGTRFWDRKEVRDILAYLRLLVNVRDDAAFGRIINVPPRSIGKTSLEELHQVAQQKSLGLMETLEWMVETQLSKTAAKLQVFKTLMNELQQTMVEQPLPLLVEKVLELTHYSDYLHKMDETKAEEREENLLELVNAVREYEEDHPEAGLEAFLQEIALLTDADSKQAEGGVVTLMTMHMAKGLEFENVHIAGCDEGIFPLVRNAANLKPSEMKAQEEEERRLFYVGATRAMKRLFLYTTTQRFWQGRVLSMSSSRFLGEIDPSTMVLEEDVDSAFMENHSQDRYASQSRQGSASGAYPQGQSGYYGRRRSTTIRKVYRDPIPLDEPVSSSRKIVADEYSQENLYFQPGMKVHHGRFGEGQIISVQGSGEDARVEVMFRNGVVRKLVLKYANLSIIGEA